MKDYNYLNIKLNDIYAVNYSLLETCNSEIWEKLLNLQVFQNRDDDNNNIDSDENSEDIDNEILENNAKSLDYYFSLNSNEIKYKKFNNI